MQRQLVYLTPDAHRPSPYALSNKEECQTQDIEDELELPFRLTRREPFLFHISNIRCLGLLLGLWTSIFSSFA